MTCARVATVSSTKTSRSGFGSTFGCPPRSRPTHSATRALAAAINGVRKRGFKSTAEGSRASYAGPKAPTKRRRAGPAAIALERAAAGMATVWSPSDPQEAPQRQPAAERGDRYAGAQEDQDQQLEIDRARRRQQGEATGQRIDQRVLAD